MGRSSAPHTAERNADSHDSPMDERLEARLRDARERRERLDEPRRHRYLHSVRTDSVSPSIHCSSREGAQPRNTHALWPNHMGPWAARGGCHSVLWLCTVSLSFALRRTVGRFYHIPIAEYSQPTDHSHAQPVSHATAGHCGGCSQPGTAPPRSGGTDCGSADYTFTRALLLAHSGRTQSA